MKNTDRANEIRRNIARRSEVGAERRKLKQEAQQLRHDRDSVNQSFISDVMGAFIDKMKLTDHAKMRYIHGSYSDDFTKHVNRHTAYRFSINPQHDAALTAYKAALIRLNETFVDGLINNQNGERQKVINYSGIKNVRDLLED